MTTTTKVEFNGKIMGPKKEHSFRINSYVNLLTSDWILIKKIREERQIGLAEFLREAILAYIRGYENDRK